MLPVWNVKKSIVGSRNEDAGDGDRGEAAHDQDNRFLDLDEPTRQVGLGASGPFAYRLMAG